MIGLNLGSGQRPFGEGWINVDKIAHEGMPAPDLICDGANLPVEWEDRFDYVVLHHVLEHFGCGEAGELIKEAYRALKPGGSLLVFVPDLRKLARLYLDEELSTQIYATNLYGAYMGNEADRHKWGFDGNSLFEFLRSPWPIGEGWSCTCLFDWRSISGADIARDDRWILGVECVK